MIRIVCIVTRIVRRAIIAAVTIRIVYIVTRIVRPVTIAAVTIRIVIIVIRISRCLVRPIRPISRSFPLLIGSFIIKSPLSAVRTAEKSVRRRNVRRRLPGIVRPQGLTRILKSRIGFAGL
jgi:hypothetical protein